VTDCERIGHFVGRVSRVGPEHEDNWHNDLEHDRMVAMSVNLSETQYSGGVLEIHDSQSGETVTVPNPVPGNAILFRLAPELKHRITRVDGGTARTAWAGWFVHGDDSPLVRPVRTTHQT
jgi:predicted 2-oxoglutarate/Fe(II)-dependent dioxygenase YbiX